MIENMLKASLESLAYLVAPRNQSATVELIMKKLRIKDSLTAEEGYHDTVRTMPRKPYPAVEGIRNVQRLLKTQNPRIGEVNGDNLVYNRFIRKLDESGFFERIYSKGTKPDTASLHRCTKALLPRISRKPKAKFGPAWKRSPL
jgi:hypothetical protein